ncbi:MAG: T9SS type A sorting domain-containing protein [Bacteroidetes bacterium]|nr:T9SS type A sorting domain-containing protein [Bacteroidota bacterium]
MKTFLFLILAVLFFPLKSFSQVDVTATSGTPAASYTNLTNTFIAINNGVHQGDIVITINSSNTNFFITLNASGAGAASYSSIRIKPGAVGAINIDNSNSGSALFWFNGVDNLTIDGTLPGGYGPLTFRNPLSSNNYAVFHFFSNAQNDTLRNCVIQSNSGWCVVIANPSTSYGNKNFYFSGNTFSNVSNIAFPQMGIYNNGQSDSITITNNYFENIVLNGSTCGSIYSNAAASNWIVKNNYVYYSLPFTPANATNIYGIYIPFTANTCQISNNTIGFADTLQSSPAAFASSAAVTFTGITGSSAQYGTTIKKNVVDGFDFSTGTAGNQYAGSWNGITYLPFYDNCYVDSNRVGKTSGTSSVKVTSSIGESFATGFLIGNNSFSNGTYIRNNSIGSIEVIGSSPTIRSRFYAVNIYSGGAITMQNNIIGDSSTIGTPNSISVGNLTSSTYGQFAGINTELNVFPALTAANNVIRNCRARTNSDSAHSVGIRTNGSAGIFTVQNNKIKNLQAVSSSTGSSKVLGILFNASSGGVSSFKGNIINSLTSTCGTGNRSGAIGIFINRQSNTDSNFVNDISTNSSTTGILGGAIGIYSPGTISNNKVYNIINTNATVNNVYAAGMVSFFEARRNLVYDIKTQTSNSSVIEGIRFLGQIIQNNVVSLGNGVTTNPVIRGIFDSSSTSGRYSVFNSVYIGGTQSSNVSNTYCFNQAFFSAVYMHNNIFYNHRSSTGSPGAGTGRHYAYRINHNSLLSSILSYSNICADGNGGTLAGTLLADINTIEDLKIASNKQMGPFCFSSDPQFNNPTNSPPDLSLPMNNKQSNGGARLSFYFNTDFNGNTRSIPSANRPDMGAIEADYGDPTIDLQEPYIGLYYTPSQALVSDNPRALNNFVFVSDNKALSNTNAPRLYFKRQADPNANLPVPTNTSADPIGWRYAEGTTSDAGAERTYSFTIDYSKMNPGSTLIGDSTYIQCLIAAEDAAGYFNSYPNGATPGTPLVNITAAPNSGLTMYQLRNPIQGTYYIAGGGTPLFNKFSDFSNYYSTGIITGDVTLIVGGDTYNDQLSIQNANNINPNQYKVTVRPDGNTLRTMQNFDNTSTYYNISMYYSRNFTIDGRDPNTGTGKYLRFINNAGDPSGTNSNVAFLTNAHKSVIRNCIFESNNSASGIVHFQNFTSAIGCDSNTISNCDFRPSTGAYPGRYGSGVYFENTFSGDSSSSGTIIDSCDFVDFYNFCINIGTAKGVENISITRNKFHQSANYGAFITPMRFQAYGTNNLIADNEIYDTYTNQEVWGMYIADAKNTTIARNKINIAPSGNNSLLAGIYLSNSYYSNINIVNNQIRIEPPFASSNPIYGIYDISSQQNINIYYNSVFIGGTSLGDNNTYCAWRENPFFLQSTWTAYNNIFFNNRTIAVGNANHFAIGNKNINFGLNCDFNFLAGTSAGVFDNYYFENLGSAMTFDTWKLQSFGRDANSLTRTAISMNAGDFFEDHPNCNLKPKTNQPTVFYVNGMGYPVTYPAVTNDFAGNPRSSTIAGGASDIGAFEVTPSSAPIEIYLPGPFVIGNDNYFYHAGRYFGSVKFNTNVQPTSLSLYYYSGVNPPNGAQSYGNSYYMILAAGTDTGLDYDIKLAFSEREMNNITQPSYTNLGIAKSSDNGTTWQFVPGSAYDNVGQFTGALAQHLTSFSLFTFTGQDNPLPVELSEFTSAVSRNDVKLKWTTVSEQNSSKFEIERKVSSSDSWARIGSVNAAGNSSQPKSYAYDDLRLQTGKYKYRLKQIDVNGTFKYYDLRNEVEVGMPKDFRMSQNYPNPFNPTSKIDYELPFDSKVEIRIYDMTGREMSVLVNQQQTAGYYTVQFNGAGLSSGTYFYRIYAKSTSGKDFSKTLKMVLVK